jgi:hypothetical protein
MAKGEADDPYPRRPIEAPFIGSEAQSMPEEGFRMSLAERLAEEFERDPKARKRIAELLIIEPDIRLAMINALIAEAATKRDLSELRAEMRAEMDQLRAEVSSNFRWTRGPILVVWGATVIRSY